MERLTHGPARLLNWASEFIAASPEIVDADDVGAEAALEAVRKGYPVIRSVGGTRYCWLSLGHLHSWLVREGKSRLSTQALAIWAVEAGWEKATFHACGMGRRLWRFPWQG